MWHFIKNLHKIPIYAGPLPSVCCMQLSHAVTCPFSKYFQILYIFAHISKYFALFNISLPFFWKIAPMPLLSRINPDMASTWLLLSIASFYLSRTFNKCKIVEIQTACLKEYCYLLMYFTKWSLMIDSMILHKIWAKLTRR